jgi:hypothetical protein
MPPKAHNALQVQASIEIAELKSDFEDMSCAYLRHHSMSDKLLYNSLVIAQILLRIAVSKSASRIFVAI